jgi:type III pantothenate kinase
MQLVIDIGNTLIKSYVFEKDNLLHSKVDSNQNWNTSLEQLLHSYSGIQKAIVSDVHKKYSEELDEFLKQIEVSYCSTALKLPFTTQYEPKIQLGSDRIDLGSCITYDWIDSEGVHQGGAISPGFGMRFKSMHDYSGRLPHLDFKKTDDPVGTSTESAINSGVYFGILNEIEGVIAWHENKIKNLTVILTGGDAERLPKPFKNSIFAHSNFLAKGLNFILALNTFS